MFRVPTDPILGAARSDEPSRTASLPRSIRGRLMLLAAAVTVPGLLLAAWLVHSAQTNHRALVERQLSETARALSLVVDRQLGQSEVLLKALATSPHLANGNYQAFHAQARSLIADTDRWIVLTSAEGQQIMNTRLPWGTPLPKNPLRPLDYAPRLAEGHTHVSNLIPSMVQSQPVISVVIPVLRDGRFTHALVLVKAPSRLSNVLSDQQLPADWIASIIDRDGTIVARSRGIDLHVGRPATADVREAIILQKAGVIESTTLDGIRTVAAFSRTPQHGWTVIVGAPSREVYAPARRLGLIAAAVAFVLVAVGVAASIRVARAIVRSVRHVVRGAEQLGHGAEFKIGATGMHETDSIAQALETSAAALRAREAELRTLNETLEARVEQRTAELADANRALSIRNRELQDFAQIASHDLQEPTRRISTFADLLKVECIGELSADARFYVERMQAAAERLSNLIADLLAFSAITTQARPRIAVDLAQTLANVMSDLEVRITETGGRIEADALEAVHADPVQVHHLMLNLVGNALKFYRPGVPPIVRVSTRREGEMVRIIVEDNGVGFNPAHAARLFTPFERLHVRADYAGTGIGLAIVRRIAEQHGGTVAATSTPNVGSRFEATLPLARERIRTRPDLRSALPAGSHI